MTEPISPAQAAAELAYQQQCWPGCLYAPNGKIEAFLGQIDKPRWRRGDVNIFILRANNQGGKSTLVANLSAYLSLRYPNQYLDSVRYLREFPRPCRGRIYTTVNAAKTTYADTIRDWFPRGVYSSTKGGTIYDSQFQFFNGSMFDIFSTERDPIQGESTTLDWAIVDEPLPAEFWGGLIARFSHGGIIIMVLTALEGSGWLINELETQERIGRDVFVTEMCAEDCCVEHGVRGHLPHAYIESLIRNCDEDELSARVYGKYLALSGAVYKRFNPDVHVLAKIPAHLREDWFAKKYKLSCICDPHDRKPFAIGWFATFQNGDTVCVWEFPDSTFPPFHKMTDCRMITEDYVSWIRKAEADIGKPADDRVIDPHFGKTPCFSSHKTIQEEFEEKGLKFRLSSSDKIPDGHILVKDLLGDEKQNKRPKIFFMDYCRNHIFGMKAYSYKETRKGAALAEMPELLYKDFPDLVRYGVLSGCFKEWADDKVGDNHVYIPPQRTGGYRGLF